jgi:hypothetical protein
MSGELVKLLSDLKEPEALQFVEKALAEGVDPQPFWRRPGKAWRSWGEICRAKSISFRT